jgi:hypothetical protein
MQIDSKPHINQNETTITTYKQLQTPQLPILQPTHPFSPHPFHLISDYLRANNGVRAWHANANGVSAVSASTATAGRALLPCDMELLREGDGRIIVGQFATRARILASKRNAVVDVEDAVAAARGPDGGSGLDAVLLGVDLAVREGAAASERGAGGLLSR